MNLFSTKETIENYAAAGVNKARRPVLSLLLLGALAGALIAFSGAAATTAAHGLANPSLIRLVSGAVFAFGLAMVVMTGAELFTGNCLMLISLLERKIKLAELLRSWLVVYLGNFAGSLAAGCAFFGQMDYGGIAVYAMKLAAAKCAMPVQNVLVLAFFCNMLVCVGVFCSLSAKDIAGRIMAAYLPVCFFVISGFEHSVANMFYVPAGLFALQNPLYAAQALAAGIDVSGLSWGAFLLRNLLPATVGNLLGGCVLAALLWFCGREKSARAAG